MKYLKYCWRFNSVVDPQDATDKYYRVKHDAFRRPVIVEEYDALHQLVGRTDYRYKFGRLTKTFSYAPSGDLKSYQVYKYGLLGNLQGVEEYRPDGVLVRVHSSDL